MNIIQGKIDCLPEETGFDSSRLEVLNKHFQKLIDEKSIRGAAYAISHKGKTIANASIGKMSMISDDAMKPDIVYDVASITKTFTTIAIMQLIEAGYFRLDTPVGEILPAFSKAPFDKITMWHLLTHTSGLYPDEGCFPEVAPKSHWKLINEAYQNRKDSDFDWVEVGISGGLRVPVGSEWQYCSFGFAVLGEVITKVSGTFCHDYIENNILKPLGMKDSGFDVNKEMAARHYVYDEEHKEWLDQVVSGAIDPKAPQGNIWDKIPSTGGGLISTTTDLLRYANMMLGMGRLGDVRILGRKAIEKITTHQLYNIPDNCWGASEKNRCYGIGFDMRRGNAFTYSDTTFVHEGSGACSMDIDPTEQLAAVWYVPWDDPDWDARALFNVQNIIWSGLK